MPSRPFLNFPNQDIAGPRTEVSAGLHYEFDEFDDPVPGPILPRGHLEPRAADDTDEREDIPAWTPDPDEIDDSGHNEPDVATTTAMLVPSSNGESVEAEEELSAEEQAVLFLAEIQGPEEVERVKARLAHACELREAAKHEELAEPSPEVQEDEEAQPDADWDESEEETQPAAEAASSWLWQDTDKHCLRQPFWLTRITESPAELLVLGQLVYLLSRSRETKKPRAFDSMIEEFDGRLWLVTTHKQLAEMIGCMSPSQVKRCLEKLRKKKLIVCKTRQQHDGRIRTFIDLECRMLQAVSNYSTNFKTRPITGLQSKR